MNRFATGGRRVTVSVSEVNGRPPTDCRQAFDAIVLILRTASRFRDLSEEFGKWRAIYRPYANRVGEFTLYAVLNKLCSDRIDVGALGLIRSSSVSLMKFTTRKEQCDRDWYRRKNILERLISWLRGGPTNLLSRFEKTPINYAGMTRMAIIERFLRMIYSYPSQT